MEDNDAVWETKLLEHLPEISPLYVLYKIPCPGQFSIHQAQNVLALARGLGLISLAVMFWGLISLIKIGEIYKKGSIMQ